MERGRAGARWQEWRGIGRWWSGLGLRQYVFQDTSLKLTHGCQVFRLILCVLR